MADTGWLTATAARNIDVGKGDWTNPIGVYTSDNNDAYNDIPSNDYNNRLNAYTFGASIPAGATITGIQILTERMGESNEVIKDYSVYLMDDTATKGDNKADTNTWWPNSDTIAYYGASNDLWGAAWTVAQVNASTFGCSLQAKNYEGYNRQAKVDHISIKVYYTTDTVDMDYLMIMGM